MPQVVWTARPDGTIDYVNERIREYPGTLRQPDGAWRWEPTLHPEDLPATVRAWADAFRTGREFEITHRFRLADGSYRWHLSRGVPVRDARGIAVKWLGTSTDIHAQKQAEEELREASRRKSEFMAMLSHELRNPLAPIRNSLYVLERAAPGGQQARRAQEVIDRQTRQLTRLVEDLLDTTRITRGKIRLQVERLELCELVRRTADDHRDDFERGGIALEVTSCTPLIIDGDPARLSQAIGNLLANAVKFTPPGGRVALSVSAEASAAVVDVKDDGAGIAPSMLDSIFDPFTQGEQSLARTQGGLGLGLAITRGVAEMHGGTVIPSRRRALRHRSAWHRRLRGRPADARRTRAAVGGARRADRLRVVRGRRTRAGRRLQPPPGQAAGSRTARARPGGGGLESAVAMPRTTASSAGVRPRTGRGLHECFTACS
jgi:PAS domain S-box-containing protein